MSFRLQPTPPARLNRCQLFGPGSNTKLFAKMAASAADVINLDLEDSVAPSDKDAARANVIAAIGAVDWGRKTLSVRINGLDTPFWYRDVVDLMEQAGDRLDATGPKNHFPLDDGQGPVLLLAGGIGVTPLIAMASALTARGRDFRMVYASRSPAAAAFADRLVAAHGARIQLHHDDQAGGPVPVAELIAKADPAAHVYVCGPKPMIDATRAAMEAAGRADAQFHAELFENTSHEAGDRPFEVEIASTGQVITVPADQTIIEALEAAGVDLVYDCQRGDCGICQTDVLEGTPDHRDVVLSKEERDSGKVMQICVSRALSDRLKLDL